MSTSFPIQFHSETVALPGMQTLWKTTSGDHAVEVAIPKEFQGSGLGLSPEDLFNYALTNCFVGTFKVYAQNSKLEFSNLKTTSKLVVDLDENKRPVMKEFFLTVTFEGIQNQEKALLLARKASTTGFILNSVKTKCSFDFKFT